MLYHIGYTDSVYILTLVYQYHSDIYNVAISTLVYHIGYIDSVDILTLSGTLAISIVCIYCHWSINIIMDIFIMWLYGHWSISLAILIVWIY